MSLDSASPSTEAAATTAAGAAETAGTMQLVRFAYAYVRPQMRMMLLSALFMTGATLLSVCVPVLAEEIVSYGTEVIMKTAGTAASADNATGDSVVAAGVSMIGLGALSERLVRPFLPFIFSIIRPELVGAGNSSDVAGGWGEELGGAAAGAVVWPSPYVEGIVCRCVLMGLNILCFHFTSLVAHLAAYQVGMRAQHALTQDSVHRVLHTEYPERVAVVNAVKLAQLMTTSARALNDTVGEVLTNVLSHIMYVLGFFVMMLLLSYQLTLTILVGVVVVQCIFFFEGRALHRQGSRVTAEEAGAQALIANLLQRSETIFVFDCRDFVLTRLAERLARVQHLTSRLNRSIHGYAAVSSGVTRLILVLALGLSNYYQQKGQLDMRHTVLYFACFQSFVNTLLTLSSNLNKTRATLGRLRALEAMLRWYSEPLPLVTHRGRHGDRAGEEEGDDNGSSSSSSSSTTAGHVEARDAATAVVSLTKVSFQYPAVPSFLSESGEDGSGPAMLALESSMDAATGARHANGVRDVTFTAATGGITALYGPSGSGKSTCLRLLCGLVRPATGTVRTHRRAVLLEQQHAIFIGSVAENILLTDLSGPATGKATALPESQGKVHAAPAALVSAEVQKRVSEAAFKSGCASFLSNPFSTLIESVDHPQFSGGQLQRISLARVFAQTDRYSLVLLDEPTSGLDKDAVSLLLETLKGLRDVHHKTVLISTHDHRVAAIADKVVDLSGKAAIE